MTDSSPSALLNLGQTLSQARQAAGLSVSALAGRLNMGIEQLNALESGDLSRLPEPVFVIAQARRIAQTLGITIDAEILELRQSADFSPKAINLNELKFTPPAAGANGRADSPSEAPTNAKPNAKGNPSGGAGAWRALASVALVCGLAAGGTVLWQQWQLQQHQQRLRQLAIARQAALVIQERQQRAARQAEAKALAQAQALQATSLTISSPAGTWLEVRTLNDQPLFRGEFRGRRPFPLGQGLKVLAGRPDLVQVQIGTGASTPLGPITPVRWQTFAAPKAPTQAPTKAPAQASKPAHKGPLSTAGQPKPKANGPLPASPSPLSPKAPSP